MTAKAKAKAIDRPHQIWACTNQGFSRVIPEWPELAVHIFEVSFSWLLTLDILLKLWLWFQEVKVVTLKDNTHESIANSYLTNINAWYQKQKSHPVRRMMSWMLLYSTKNLRFICIIQNENFICVKKWIEWEMDSGIESNTTFHTRTHTDTGRSFAHSLTSFIQMKQNFLSIFRCYSMYAHFNRVICISVVYTLNCIINCWFRNASAWQKLSGVWRKERMTTAKPQTNWMKYRHGRKKNGHAKAKTSRDK